MIYFLFIPIFSLDIFGLLFPQKVSALLTNQSKQNIYIKTYIFLFSLIYELCIIIGILFSNQRVLFIIMFLLGLIPKQITNKYHIFIDALLSIIILLFIIINDIYFHVPIDVFINKIGVLYV